LTGGGRGQGSGNKEGRKCTGSGERQGWEASVPKWSKLGEIGEIMHNIILQLIKGKEVGTSKILGK